MLGKKQDMGEININNIISDINSVISKHFTNILNRYNSEKIEFEEFVKNIPIVKKIIKENAELKEQNSFLKKNLDSLGKKYTELFLSKEDEEEEEVDEEEDDEEEEEDEKEEEDEEEEDEGEDEEEEKERNMTVISWILIIVPFVLMSSFVLIAKFKEMREESKAKKINKINRNRDIVLYHDHGEDYDKYNHGIGIREQQHTPGESIEEKRNYKYEIKKTNFDGINQMRFIRDQRLSTY